MTKFVPKEVLGDSTFVAVYDPESGDTGYVRMGDLVDMSETTVTAVTGPGGGIEVSVGDISATIPELTRSSSSVTMMWVVGPAASRAARTRRPLSSRTASWKSARDWPSGA